MPSSGQEETSQVSIAGSKLKYWIEPHYRERIDPDDLRDPSLLEESLRALEDLAPILDLPVNLLIDG